MRSKHLPLLDPGVESLYEFEFIPEFIDISITAGIVEHVAGKLSGSASLSGFDLATLRDLLLSHGQASRRLRISFAKFVEWMANNFPPWAAYRALIAYRELALGKNPIGIRPPGSRKVCFSGGPTARDNRVR